jgi:hypothetical protein
VESGRRFVPSAGLGLAVKIFLSLSILLEAVMLASDYQQYQLALRMIAGANVADAELESNDARQMALGLIHFLLFIAGAIIFVIWFYRVHANLEPLGARHLIYTSGWAAGSWFVPILNLFRPVQIAQEIWRNSDPEAIGPGDRYRDTSGNSTLIGFWWAMWIFTNILSNISVRMAWAVNSPESLRSATVMSMVDAAVTIPAALLAIAVVSAIDSRQMARAEALHLQGSWQ